MSFNFTGTQDRTWKNCAPQAYGMAAWALQSRAYRSTRDRQKLKAQGPHLQTPGTVITPRDSIPRGMSSAKQGPGQIQAKTLRPSSNPAPWLPCCEMSGESLCLSGQGPRLCNGTALPGFHHSQHECTYMLPFNKPTRHCKATL